MSCMATTIIMTVIAILTMTTLITCYQHKQEHFHSILPFIYILDTVDMMRKFTNTEMMAGA